MRRLLLIPLACLLLALPPVGFARPPAASARDSSTGSGSLVVSDAWVRQIVVQGSGTIYGHIDSGTLTVVSYDAADTRAPQVNGAVGKTVGNTVRYSGTDMRFLLPNGRYLITLEGAGIDISAVGQGTITAAGLGTDDDGTLAVNGGKALQVGFTSGLAVFGTKKSTDVAAATAGAASSKGASK
jgi:hypothetical protein